VWVLQTFLLALVPHHYSKAGLLCGFFTIIGVIVYAMLCPTLNIPFTGSNRQRTFIQMRYGSSFYLAIAAGISNYFVITRKRASVGGLGSTMVVHLDGSQEPGPGSSPDRVRKLLPNFKNILLSI
jgi:hypothetical protein